MRKARKKVITAASSAAVHTDALWDNPGVIENVTAEPVNTEGWTKKQYFDFLAKHGKRMKDQQESDPGPHYDPLPAPTPASELPPVPRRDFTANEARLIIASAPVRQKYGILEALYCSQCFARKLDAYRAKYIETNKKLGIICQCGTQLYTPIGGFTSEVTRRLANTSATSDNHGTGIISTALGGLQLPVVNMEQEEADIMRGYLAIMQAFDYEVRWFCANCFDNSLDANDSMGIHVTATSFAAVCAKSCRMIAYGHPTVRTVGTVIH